MKTLAIVLLLALAGAVPVAGYIADMGSIAVRHAVTKDAAE